MGNSPNQSMPGLTLPELLAPFRFVDIASIYDQYSSPIDFVLAFLLFLGIAKATLQKRFEGRAGQLLTITVALLLSVGFSLTERKMNVSLRSFGPLAAFILVFLVAIVLHNLLRTTGLTHSSSLATTYIIVYLSLQMVSPTVLSWIAETAPFLNSLLGLVFIASAIKLVISFFSRKAIWNVPKLSGNALQSQAQLGDAETERSLVKNKIRKFAKKDVKRSGDIGGYLHRIMAALDQGNTAETRQNISEELKRIGQGEHEILARLDYIDRLNNSIERHDASRISQLETQYQAAPGKEKDLLKKEIDLEQKKIVAEENVRSLKRKILGLTAAFNNSVNAAANSVTNPAQAKRYLQAAISQDLAIKQSFNDISILEKDLRRLIGKEEKVLVRL